MVVKITINYLFHLVSHSCLLNPSDFLASFVDLRHLRSQSIVAAANGLDRLIRMRCVHSQLLHYRTHDPIGPASEADAFVEHTTEPHSMTVGPPEMPLRGTHRSSKVHDVSL